MGQLIRSSTSTYGYGLVAEAMLKQWLATTTTIGLFSVACKKLLPKTLRPYKLQTKNSTTRTYLTWGRANSHMVFKQLNGPNISGIHCLPLPFDQGAAFLTTYSTTSSFYLALFSMNDDFDTTLSNTDKPYSHQEYCTINNQVNTIHC